MFKSVTLEVSLKPFKQTDDAYIKEVCEQIFTQWRPLLKNRETISIMLWTSDGSEILDYAGDLKDEFEWARFVGTATISIVPPIIPADICVGSDTTLKLYLSAAFPSFESEISFAIPIPVVPERTVTFT